ncbi:YqgE/AlgH family protein [Petrachloros mirabilis]
MPPFSEYSLSRSHVCVQRVIASVLLLIALLAPPVLAGTEFVQSSVGKGVFLVASPTMTDPNFSQTVILMVEHGPGGSLGVVLNRSTRVLLSDALPELAVLKGTAHRLFAGGPVEPTRLVMLFRLKEPPDDAQSVFDGVYVGGTPKTLERIMKEAKPNETFRAFAGYAGWGPGQLNFEMLQGAWATLPADSKGIFDQEPATLWEDCVSRLQAPRVIAN